MQIYIFLYFNNLQGCVMRGCLYVDHSFIRYAGKEKSYCRVKNM